MSRGVLSRRAALAVVVLSGCGRIGFDTGTSSDARPCPNGYTAAGSSCYRLQDDAEALPWLEAEAFCEAAGAHLVVIDDIAEAIRIRAALASTNIDFWIGASDRVTEGVYLSVTGAPLAVTTWSAGEPDGPDDCVRITNQFEIQDADCAGVDDFVCELDGEPAVPAAFTP